LDKQHWHGHCDEEGECWAVTRVRLEKEIQRCNERIVGKEEPCSEAKEHEDVSVHCLKLIFNQQ